MNSTTKIFRDFNEYIEMSFLEFLARQKEDSIPLHRISQIKHKGIPVFTRAVFCEHCGKPLKGHDIFDE